MSDEKKDEKTKKPIYKRWWFWVVIVIIIAIAATGGDDEQVAEEPAEEASAEETSNNEEEQQTEEEPKQEEPEREEPVEEEPATLEDKVRKIIADTVGLETRGEDRIVAIYTEEAEQGGTFVLIDLIGEDGLTLNTTKSAMWMYTLDIFKPLFEIEEVSEAKISWQLELMDQYGNTDYGHVMGITFSRETAEKVNWDGIPYENVPKIADEYFEHPALRN